MPTTKKKKTCNKSCKPTNASNLSRSTGGKKKRTVKRPMTKKRRAKRRTVHGEGWVDDTKSFLKKTKLLSTVGKTVLPAAGAALGSWIAPGAGTAVGSAGGTQLNNLLRSSGYGKHRTRHMYATGLTQSGGGVMRAGGGLRRSGAGPRVHRRVIFST